MKHLSKHIPLLSLLAAVFLPALHAEEQNGGVQNTNRPAEDLEHLAQMKAVSVGPIASGPFKPTVEDVLAAPCPEWFRDAKLGFWSHWGAGCISGVSQNYARDMNQVGSPAYNFHLAHFGDIHQVGYKDTVKYWTAAKWDPDDLMKLYKAAGAKYFVAMGRHLDNIDGYDSQYTRWNSVRVGPHKDVAGLWRQAALKEGLRFGMSFHPDSNWYRSSIKDNAPYVWDTPENWSLHLPPLGTPGRDEEYNNGFYARMKDAIDKYQPDLVYFDSTLPNPWGPKLMAHFLNSNIAHHNGINEGLFTIKKTDNCPVIDLERGEMGELCSTPWQCDTSESGWFYLDEAMASNELYTMHRSSTTMLHLLIDTVSKNGNLLMNIPQRADGTIDEHCENLLVDFADWMKINSESIFGTRPWEIYGEGPSELPPRPAPPKYKILGGINRNSLISPMTSRDIRFTTKGKVLYAFALGWPRDRTVTIRSLAKPAGKIVSINLLGSDAKLDWKQTDEALVIHLPKHQPCQHAITFKILSAPEESLRPAPGWKIGVPSLSGQ